MKDREFNLLEEPWIVAMRPDGSTEEVSLPEVFARANEFRGLAGETATQDVAMLRLLLAVLYTVIARYDEDGEEAEVEGFSEALSRWKHIWNQRRFPMEAINRYLDSYRDRFWLFDTERPFFQVPASVAVGVKAGGTVDYSDYFVKSMNHEISESNNKVRFFLQRAGEEAKSLNYGEAARWLACLMPYDTAVKLKGKKNLVGIDGEEPKGSKCWLGTFTAVMADGDNLFETLMMNLVLPSSSNKLTFDGSPSWEAEKANVSQHNIIVFPTSPSALYTMQTRRVSLRRENGKVTGYGEICGNVFSGKDTFAEPMAAWKKDTKNEGRLYPRNLRHERQVWRDFSALLMENSEEGKCPGVVTWLNGLVRRNILSKSQIRLRTVSAEYDGMGYCLKNISPDFLTFSAGMLSEKGDAWVSAILNEIEVAEALANQLAYLVVRVSKATGDVNDKTKKAKESAAKEAAYFAFDIPFREWLEQINPEQDEMSEAAERWWNTSQKIIRKLGQEIISDAGPQALVGRTVKEKKGSREEEVTYSAPEAYRYFMARTASRKALTTGGKKNG